MENAERIFARNREAIQQTKDAMIEADARDARRTVAGLRFELTKGFFEGSGKCKAFGSSPSHFP